MVHTRTRTVRVAHLRLEALLQHVLELAHLRRELALERALQLAHLSAAGGRSAGIGA